jgi:hypothetical protein
MELMKVLKKATSFCKKYNLTELNNQAAPKQYVLDLKERCPNLGNKPFKDIVDVMIDVLHKYYMGFNKMVGRKSCSGHDESIMITCVKYLFGIVTKDSLEAASKFYTPEELARTQCRVRLLHPLSKGLTKKIMPAAELLTILGIELKTTSVKL